MGDPPPLPSFEQTSYHSGHHRIQSLYTQHLQHFNTPSTTNSTPFTFNTVNMRFTAAVAALAGAAVADHMGNSTMATSASDVYVTDVVTAYTTYCPNPTKITHKGETYTVSEATTLTITNCPGGCTVTKPASSAVVSSAPVVPETTAPVETTPVAMPMPSAGAPYPSANGTTTAPYGTGVPAGTGSSATGSSTAPAYTGAANQAYLSASAGFLALFGLVAAF